LKIYPNRDFWFENIPNIPTFEKNTQAKNPLFSVDETVIVGIKKFENSGET
jgi:hypothetical protein